MPASFDYAPFHSEWASWQREPRHNATSLISFTDQTLAAPS